MLARRKLDAITTKMGSSFETENDKINVLMRAWAPGFEKPTVDSEAAEKYLEGN